MKMRWPYLVPLAFRMDVHLVNPHNICHKIMAMTSTLCYRKNVYNTNIVGLEWYKLTLRPTICYTSTHFGQKQIAINQVNREK